MDPNIITCVSRSLIASIVMTVIALLLAPIQKLRRRNALSRDRVSTLLAVSFFLLLSIIFLRFGEFQFAAISDYGHKEHAVGIQTTWDAWVASILAALRTISMEESYGEFVDNLRCMIGAVIPHRKTLGCLSVINASILNLLAPIAGGAIILEILASIFPKLKFWRARYLSFREKAYFSELNAESLAMAKSLSQCYAKDPKKLKPFLIFTDVYIDDEAEKEYELLLEAKHMGAICVRDDLAHVPKLGFGKRSYFLMDRNEFGNLQTLVALSDDRNVPYIRTAKVYLFVQSDAYIRLEQQVKNRLTKLAKSKQKYQRREYKLEQIRNEIKPIEEEQKALAEEYKNLKDDPTQLKRARPALVIKAQELEDKRKPLDRKQAKLDSKQQNKIKKALPNIIPVFGFRNLVLNLFSDVPLYEPLIHRENKKALRITILGSGTIGTEAFLNAYWLGQMMFSNGSRIEPCNLHINILSKEPEKDFFSKLDYISPEIRDSICIERSPKQDASKESEDHAVIEATLRGIQTPYATVRYTETDIKIGSFWDNASADSQHMLDSDYIIVALGTDLDNMSVAEKLRTFVGQKHLTDPNATDTVIAYAVFNSELCETLNGNPPAKKPKKEKLHKADEKPKAKNPSEKKQTPKIYMHAFGSLEQVYSTDNVFLSESKALAEEMGDTYLKQHYAHAYITEHATRSKNENKNFTFWANISRVRHTKYKLFSLGWINFSLLDEDEADLPGHAHRMQELCAQYRRIATLPHNSLADLDRRKYEDLESKKHHLAWLEHRRWCAFTRTMGFRSTEALEENLRTEGSHKNMPLKLHPCLVEAYLHKDKNDKDAFIYGTFDKRGKLEKATVFTQDTPPSGQYDPLDDLSRKWQRIYHEKKDPEEKPDDFKMYDYYRYEYGDCIRSSAFLRWNKDGAISMEDAKKQNTKKRRAYIPWLTSWVLNLLCWFGKKHGIYPYHTKEDTQSKKRKQYKPGKQNKQSKRDRLNQQDWIIPVDYMLKLIRKTHRAVDQKKLTEQSFMDAYKKSMIPEAFVFEETLFVPKHYEFKPQKETSVTAKKS